MDICIIQIVPIQYHLAKHTLLRYILIQYYIKFLQVAGMSRTWNRTSCRIFRVRAGNFLSRHFERKHSYLRRLWAATRGPHIDAGLTSNWCQAEYLCYLGYRSILLGSRDSRFGLPLLNESPINVGQTRTGHMRLPLCWPWWTRVFMHLCISFSLR